MPNIQPTQDTESTAEQNLPKNELASYRFTSDEEPTDEQLEELLRNALTDAKQKALAQTL